MVSKRPTPELASDPVRPRVYEILYPVDEMREGEEEISGKGGEQYPVSVVPDVKGPTREEREAHEMAAHVPYRPWCGHCVAGRGKTRYHHRHEGDREGEVPLVSMDYGFLGAKAQLEETEELVKLTFLGVRDRESGAIASLALPVKGSGDGYATKRMTETLDEWGRGECVIKCDGEPAILELARAIKERRSERTQLEEAPRGEKRANGEAEATVGIVAGHVRTMKSALEAKIGLRISVERAIIKWMVEYAGVAYTRFKVGEDGRTAYQRLKGRRFGKPVVEIGERVMYEVHRPTGGRAGKLEARFAEGMYVGLKSNSQEYWVCNEEGLVVQSNTIKRKPAEERWDRQWVLGVIGTPWLPGGPRALREGGVREGAVREGQTVRDDEGPVEREPATAPGQPRRTKITKKALGTFGRTEGCPGCAAVDRGGPYEEHTTACRDRIERDMEEHGGSYADRLQSRRERSSHIIAQRVEESDRAGRYDRAATPMREEGEQRPSDSDPAAPMGEDSGERRVGGKSTAARERTEGEPRKSMRREASVKPATPEITPARGDASVSPATHERRDALVMPATPERRDASGVTATPVIIGGSSGSGLMDVDRPGGRKRAAEEAEARGVGEETGMEVDPESPMDVGCVEINAICAAMGERSSTDVAEIYSPPRVTEAARRMGMVPGVALDLTTVDDDGNPWDFSVAGQRRKARELIQHTKPILLVGSPMCRPYSQLQTLNNSKRDPEVVRRERLEADVHLEFCVQLYNDQRIAGRYFLHEHPKGATSWKNDRMMELASKKGVLRLVGHMCPHGMESEDAEGKGLVLKPTGWLTNCPAVAEEVSAKCTNLDKEVAEEKHRHVMLMSGRAKACEVYPRALARAIARGLRTQLKADGMLEANGVGLICQMNEEMDPWEECVHPHEEEYLGEARDDLTGATLDAKLVKAARDLELEFIEKKPLYEVVPVEMAWEATGAAPISTKWVDIDKGGPGAEEYRSRWVARQFKDSVTDEFFAATPPWEAIRLLISLAASQGGLKSRSRNLERKMERVVRSMCGKAGPESRRPRGVRGIAHWVSNRQGKGVLKLDLLDISRAHFNAKPKTETFVELPPERAAPGMCGKLLYNLYGTRGAAQAWEDHYGDHMVQWGFQRGRSNPCVFVHPTRELAVVVHGDDFVSLGADGDLDWLGDQLRSVYEFKHRGRLGPEKGDDKSVRVLNRVIEWGDDEIRMEADQRHAEIVVSSLGLEECRATGTPGAKEKLVEEGDDEGLEGSEASRYRSVAARINYLSSDRPELQYATKEACRSMAKPTRGSWKLVKRMARYLKGAPRLVQRFGFQEMPETVVVTGDSDYAGCRQTRKSTSGGAMTFGKHMLKTWSSTQAVIALSSGEAEYYAMLKAASAGLGMVSLAEDLGLRLGLELETDSTAAKGIAGRKGLGKTKHLAVCFLWLQERVRLGDILVRKVPTAENRADLMTKHLAADRVKELLERLGFRVTAGRHELTPKVATV